jgi:hypothetical protein
MLDAARGIAMLAGGTLKLAPTSSSAATNQLLNLDFNLPKVSHSQVAGI